MPDRIVAIAARVAAATVPTSDRPVFHYDAAFHPYAADDIRWLLKKVRELEAGLAGLLEIRESFAEHELQGRRGLTAEQIKERWAAAQAALAGGKPTT